MKLSELIVLLAEDQEDDVFLFKRAIARAVSKHTLRVVSDGTDVIAYLRGDGEFADRSRYPFPNVLLLDIKMPRLSGLEVLDWLNQHEECSIIPTIIFTSSEQPQDIRRAYLRGANAYFTKPVAFDELQELMTVMFSYWCRAHVPTPPPSHKCQ
jgi:CheY-like chemotaxis protein